MDMYSRSTTLVLVITCLCITAGAAEPEPFKEGWPRLFQTKGSQVVVHQPQLTEWEDHKILRAQAAVAVTLKGQKTEYFGAIYFETGTEVDFVERMVVMKSLRLTKLVFPNVNASTAKECQATVMDALPKDKVMLISLDRVLASMERSKLETRTTPVNLDPPPIFYSDQPAILVLFMGEPKFEAISADAKLLYAVNTNWDIIRTLSSSRYYILNGESWYVTANVLEGPWRPVSRLPAAFFSLPDDENWKAVKEHIPGKQATEVPKVIVSKEPA